MSAVVERLQLVTQRIRGAAERAGRDPASVRLVAVSKTQPAAAVRAAYEAGQRDFGENYVQELVAKAKALEDLRELRWHMVGHLQRNKVRQVLPVATAVQSVDSVELAAELGKRAAALSRRLLVLVEVNIAEEPQKHGVSPAALEPVLAAVEREAALELRGLMCVPPLGDTALASRPHFDALVALRDAHGGAARLPELSMGMTADLEPAIEAGATIVRVGTAIFGERPPRA